MPSLNPATAISGLKVEPGAVFCWVALLYSGLDSSVFSFAQYAVSIWFARRLLS